ncbi:HD domain-containing protein [Streptomyces griseoincarnatus]|uniref:HD domain-containing protein n=1 Tax=Streptomyces sp. RK31 TaxID=2824892 RepID=UPI001FFD0802|nr:HD domain-containing protein [Streptomyces sp. RK31]
MTTKTGDMQVPISFDGAVADSAYTHVRGILEPAILNHSIRVWLVAEHLGRRQGIGDLTREALAVACLFHDAGTATPYDGPQRFEVEGADAARAFLNDHDWPAPLIQEVWEAVALHTSPGIAERMGLLPQLVRQAVLVDFGGSNLIDATDQEPLLSDLARFPRLDIETVLGDAVVAQAVRCPQKAPPSSWPGGLLAAHLAHPMHGVVNPAF